MSFTLVQLSCTHFTNIRNKKHNECSEILHLLNVKVMEVHVPFCKFQLLHL